MTVWEHPGVLSVLLFSFGSVGRVAERFRLHIRLRGALFCVGGEHKVRRRPYRVECTVSLPTSEIKRRRARLVLGWGEPTSEVQRRARLVQGCGAAWEHAWALLVYVLIFFALAELEGGPGDVSPRKPSVAHSKAQ